MKLIETPSVRLLKHIVRCYLRLSEHQKAREALKQCLPDPLRDQTFASTVRGEESVQKWLALLLKNVTGSENSVSTIGNSNPISLSGLNSTSTNPAAAIQNTISTISSSTGSAVAKPPMPPNTFGYNGLGTNWNN